MASTPIIRYYDHLRLVYEVESRMREIRQNNQGKQQQPQTQPVTPGESKQNLNRKDGGSRVDPPQQLLQALRAATVPLELRADQLSDGEPLEDFWQRRQAEATGQRRYRRTG